MGCTEIKSDLIQYLKNGFKKPAGCHAHRQCSRDTYGVDANDGGGEGVAKAWRETSQTPGPHSPLQASLEGTPEIPGPSFPERIRFRGTPLVGLPRSLLSTQSHTAHAPKRKAIKPAPPPAGPGCTPRPRTHPTTLTPRLVWRPQEEQVAAQGEGRDELGTEAAGKGTAARPESQPCPHLLSRGPKLHLPPPPLPHPHSTRQAGPPSACSSDSTTRETLTARSRLTPTLCPDTAAHRPYAPTCYPRPLHFTMGVADGGGRLHLPAPPTGTRTSLTRTHCLRWLHFHPQPRAPHLFIYGLFLAPAQGESRALFDPPRLTPVLRSWNKRQISAEGQVNQRQPRANARLRGACGEGAISSLPSAVHTDRPPEQNLGLHRRQAAFQSPASLPHLEGWGAATCRAEGSHASPGPLGTGHRRLQMLQTPSVSSTTAHRPENPPS